MELSSQRAFESALSAPLEHLVHGVERSTLESSIGLRWNLPQEGVDSLVRWGLPVATQQELLNGPHLVGAVQGAIEPELQERGYSAYCLGTYWRRQIGVRVGEGNVIGIPDDPSLHVSLLNSSLSAFVEIAWRWRAARLSLVNLVDDYERLYVNLGRFSDWVHTRDPATHLDSRYGWWDGLIEGW